MKTEIEDKLYIVRWAMRWSDAKPWDLIPLVSLSMCKLL